MYGLGSGPSKTSAARSSRTIGATGRNCSRPLTSLSLVSVSRRPGLASSDRCPSARGPYSDRPANQATTPSAASTCATSSARSAGRSYGQRAVSSQAASSSSVQPRPSAAPGIGAARSPASAAACSAPPSAVPASPAAGCTQIVLERPLGGQPRVGHAVQRDPAGHGQHPVAGPRVQPAGQLEQHLLQPGLHAGGQVGVLGGPLRARAPAA